MFKNYRARSRLHYGYKFELFKELLEYAANHKINMVAASSSVYGDSMFLRKTLKMSHLLIIILNLSFYLIIYVRDNFNKINSQIVGMRYFNVYGPYESHKEVIGSVIFHFYNQLLDHGMLKLFRGSHGYDDGEQRRDFVFRQRYNRY